MSPRQCRCLANDPKQVRPFVDSILRQLGDWGSPHDRQAIRLSLVEMILNAIEHGNLAIGYDHKHAALLAGTFEELVDARRRLEPYASRQVTVCYHADPWKAVFNVCDEGDGFDWHAVLDPCAKENLERGHGRGIHLARAHMDVCLFEHPGNAVTLVKYVTKLRPRIAWPQQKGRRYADHPCG